jgi:zinc protease
MRSRGRTALLLLTLPAALGTGPLAQQSPGAPAQQALGAPAIDATIPLDPAVRTGKLENGLTYYIRRNERPEERALLRLAVNAGSLDEEDDQQGLAHFLEHMAFNGTENFKPGELVSYFESAGARLGPHLNAYTSFEETVYMLQVATAKEGLMEKGLLALADFAGGMKLDAAEIDRERGVVIEEWRGGLGAGSRIRDKQVPILYHNSRYARRLPIGKPEVLKTFTPERLAAFYREHYRPDRMAVVVVGTIAPEQVEAQIKSTFAPLKNPPQAPSPRDDEVPMHQELLVSVATDREAQRSSVSLVRKRPSAPSRTVGDYRRDLVERLVSQMIGERFDEMAQKPDAKFLGAASYAGALNPEVATFTLGASVIDGGIVDGLAALATEAQRLREHGFGGAELERARKWTLAAYERAYAERDKTESSAFASAYVSHFLNDEPSPSIEYEVEMVRWLLPTISLEDVNATIRKLLVEESRVVLAVSPEREGIAVPTGVELRKAIEAARAAPVTAWTDAGLRSELLEKEPLPGVVAGRREIEPLGVTIVRFANGIEAWLKPTDFKNDQVLFTMYAPGGASLADPARYFEAVLSPAYVTLSGAAGLRMTDLPKVLAGRLASARPFVSLNTHGISGSASPAELETALQLLYAYFTMPGGDPDAFALLKKQVDASVRNRDTSPSAAFNEVVAEVNTSGHYTATPMTSERVATLDRDAMASFYRQRFSNAADFTLFIVGAFSVGDVEPLLAQYVGSLPSSGKAESAVKDVGIRFPETVRTERVRKGSEPRSQTVISFFADPPPGEEETVRLSAAADVLEIALRDVLREELGQTYSVNAGFVDSRPQSGTGRVVVSFGSSPENVDQMAERVVKELRRLKEQGPSADLTNRTKESALRELEVALKQNGYWLGALQSKHLLGRDPLLILSDRDRIEALTPAALHGTFTRYFPLDRYTVVSLVPEM